MNALRKSLALITLAAAVVSVRANAQEYPSKPIRLVLPAPGGGSDVVARIIAPKISEGVGQQLVIDNRGSLEPSPLVPGVPTLAASGVPGYESVSPQGVFAPARTPAAIVNRLNHEIARALNAADARERLFASGMQVASTTPESFAAWLKVDIERAAKLIKRAGIKDHE